MEKEHSKLFDIIIVLFLLLSPVIDLITGIEVNNNFIYTIGMIIRPIILLIIFMYLINLRRDRGIILLLLIYGLITTFSIFMIKFNSILDEISIVTKIFYLPILILFFNRYKNKFINNKLLFIILIEYLLMIIIPYIINKDLFLFSSKLSISYIILILFPLVYNYLLNKNYILRYILIFLTVISTYILRENILIIGLIIYVIYFYLKYILKEYKNSTNIKKTILIIIPIIFIIGSIFLIPRLTMYHNILEIIKKHNITGFNQDFINYVIFNGKLNVLDTLNAYYNITNIYGHLIGLTTNITSHVIIGIDFFDIFYNIGIIGSITYVIVIINGFIKSRTRGLSIIIFSLFILYSIIIGNILINPMVTIYLAVCMRCKNE